MDWMFMHGQLIFNCLVIVIVGGLYLYSRWARNRQQMEHDLERLLQVGLDWLKDWAGDQLADVGQENVWKVADVLYGSIRNTPLGRFVDEATFRSLLWGLFCKMRDRFTEMNIQAMKAPVIR